MGPGVGADTVAVVVVGGVGSEAPGILEMELQNLITSSVTQRGGVTSRGRMPAYGLGPSPRAPRSGRAMSAVAGVGRLGAIRC